ncbi:MAG: hypothetical protein ACT4PP_08225 [Sporichthyaceae bacterium]
MIRFPGTSWDEIEALPQSVRWGVQRAIFSLLDDPVPVLAEPFPQDAPLRGVYELHLPADYTTIWYVVSEHDGREVISIQHVRLEH